MPGLLRKLALPAACAATLLAACEWAEKSYGLARATARRGGPQPGDAIPMVGPAFDASPDAALFDRWYDRVFLGSYRKVGRRSPKWDAAAEAFIRASVGRIFRQSKGASVDDLVGRGRTLLANGCDDPLVLYFAAWAEDDFDVQSRAGTELLERALADMHEVAYPRVVAYDVAVALLSEYERSDEGVGKRDAVQPVELRWFLESLDDGSYGPDEDAVLLWQIGGMSSFFSRNRATILPALEARGWIDPWLRLYLAGERAITDAWESRGDKYASKVTDKGWEGMAQSLEVARKALVASWEKRKDRPEAAGAMVRVAMAAGRPGESPRLWFDRSVRARFDYMPAYRDLLNALRTRWSGDPSALPAFARACAATRRFDTEVPLIAFEAVQWMEWDRIWEASPLDEEGDSHLLLPPIRRPPSVYLDSSIYDEVAAVLERYRREPNQTDWLRYARLQAAIAYKAGRYEDARRFLHQSDRVLSGEARKAVGEPFLEARIEAYAGPDRPSLRRAEQLYDAGQTSEAATLFEQASARAAEDAKPYLAQRLAVASTETKLADGSVVRFLPAAGLAGWTPSEGKWVVEPDGSLLGTSGIRGLLIVADARVGSEFEIEADVEIASTTNGQFQAGIVFGEAISFSTYRWSSFRWKKTAHEGEVAYFSRHFGRPMQSISRKVPMRNHVRVQSRDGRLSAWLGGEPVVSDYLPEWRPPRGREGQVGFGAYVDDNTFSVRYRDVKLRRLTSAPRQN